MARPSTLSCIMNIAECGQPSGPPVFERSFFYPSGVGMTATLTGIDFLDSVQIPKNFLSHLNICMGAPPMLFSSNIMYSVFLFTSDFPGLILFLILKKPDR